jgi:D-arabinose 1-dehydrogenase-like Zn-dependent alcohol dehydrogenase
MNPPSTMQALQMRGPGELVLTTLPVPAPGPRDVLIRTLAATICTSDLHDLRAILAIALPRVLGHEAAGVVVACGAEVREFTRGCASRFIPSCRAAAARSARGFGHLCSRMGHLAMTATVRSRNSSCSAPTVCGGCQTKCPPR